LAVAGIQGLQEMVLDIPLPGPGNGIPGFSERKICSGFYMMVTSSQTANRYMMTRSRHTGSGIPEPGNPMKR
jgi:hypothetical protein